MFNVKNWCFTSGKAKTPNGEINSVEEIINNLSNGSNGICLIFATKVTYNEGSSKYLKKVYRIYFDTDKFNGVDPHNTDQIKLADLLWNNANPLIVCRVISNNIPIIKYKAQKDNLVNVCSEIDSFMEDYLNSLEL
jgi:hypothetical protein